MGVGAFAPAPVSVCPACFLSGMFPWSDPGACAPTDEVPRRHDCSATRLRRLLVPTGRPAGRRLPRRRSWRLWRSRRRARWHAAWRHPPRWRHGASRARIRPSGRHRPRPVGRPSAAPVRWVSRSVGGRSGAGGLARSSSLAGPSPPRRRPSAAPVRAGPPIGLVARRRTIPSSGRRAGWLARPPSCFRPTPA
jgi:hypothetical protein